MAVDSEIWVFFEVFVTAKKVLVWRTISIYGDSKTKKEQKMPDEVCVAEILDLTFAWVSVIR